MGDDINGSLSLYWYQALGRLRPVTAVHLLGPPFAPVTGAIPSICRVVLRDHGKFLLQFAYLSSEHVANEDGHLIFTIHGDRQPCMHSAFEPPDLLEGTQVSFSQR